MAQRDPGEGKHERIIEAAARCFARKGYHATRTLDIAREAGVGEGTLYNYFDDKVDLFKRVLAEINRRIEVARTEGLSAGVSARERLVQTAANMERYLSEHHDDAVILCRELRDRDASDLFRTWLVEQLRPIEEMVVELMDECGGHPSREQVASLQVALLGGMDVILNRWMLGGFVGAMEPGPVTFVRTFISLLEGWGKSGGGR